VSLVLGNLINSDNVMLVLGMLLCFALLLRFSSKNISNYTKKVIIAICQSFITGDEGCAGNFFRLVYDRCYVGWNGYANIVIIRVVFGNCLVGVEWKFYTF